MEKNLPAIPKIEENIADLVVIRMNFMLYFLYTTKLVPYT